MDLAELVFLYAGNYRGYYTKRRFHQDPYRGDERLQLIPKEWLKDKRVLDIGCNMGKVSIEIGMLDRLSIRVNPLIYTLFPLYYIAAQCYGAYRVTGVDIDGELIRRASRQSEWPTI